LFKFLLSLFHAAIVCGVKFW